MRLLRVVLLMSLLFGVTLQARQLDGASEPWRAIFLAWVSMVATLEMYFVWRSRN